MSDLWLGKVVDGGQPLVTDADDLTTHGVIVGMTGSGKTGLGIVLIEEALRAGIPALVLDPKGDMGNLALRLAALDAAAFAPWAGGDAAAAAATWRDGLAGWDLDGEDIAALDAAAEVTIYTPGSLAGVPLDVVGSLAPPDGLSFEDDAEALREAIAAYVVGLLATAGIDADPVTSREVALLTTLVETAWTTGTALDLAGLIAQVMDPPLRKLGVFELDQFFPPDDRGALAMRLNALVASPSFATWMQGEPVDIGGLLHGADGLPRCAVIALAHLTEPERQFVVALVLSRVVTWMRAQPGTSALRALVYMDEVAGYAPPTAVPPAKRPILTLLKQARAYGVGIVLATQNPVDLDYKALSNAGTWMIGRLQTEQDRDRLVGGLPAAAAGLADAIAGLEQRQFVLHRAGGDEPVVFTTRWAMSYLRGPLTKAEIERLTPDSAVSAVAPRAAPVLAADQTTVAPPVADGVRVAWLDPAAPWAAAVSAVQAGTDFRAALAARVHLRFDDARMDVRHTEEWEAVLHPLTASPEVAATIAVDYDERDLRAEPPPGATYRLPDAPIATADYFTAVERDLRAHLVRARTETIFRNRALKLYSRPGEADAAFLARCEAAAGERADAEAADVGERFAQRLAREREQVETAGRRVTHAEVDVDTRRQQEVVAGAGALLGVLLGGRGRTAGALGGVASRRGTATRAAQRLQGLRDKLADEEADLVELEAGLADALADLADEWTGAAADIEPVELALSKTDVTVDDLVLLWIPTA